MKKIEVNKRRAFITGTVLWIIVLVLNKISQPYHLSLILFHLTPLNIGLPLIALFASKKINRRKFNKASLIFIWVAMINLSLYCLAALLTDTAFSIGAFLYLIPKITDLFFLYIIFSYAFSHRRKNYFIYGAFFGQLILLLVELAVRADDFSNVVLLRDGDKSLVSGGFSEIHVMAIFWISIALLHPRILLPGYILAVASLSRTAVAAGTLSLLVNKSARRSLFVLIAVAIALGNSWSDTRLTSILEKNPGNSLDFCYFKTGTGAGYRLDKIVYQLERSVKEPFRYEPVRQYSETSNDGCQRLQRLLLGVLIMVLLPGLLPVASSLGWAPGIIAVGYILVHALKNRIWLPAVLITGMLTTVGPFFFWWLPISPYEELYYGIGSTRTDKLGVTTYSDISWAWIALVVMLVIKRTKSHHDSP